MIGVNTGSRTEDYFSIKDVHESIQAETKHETIGHALSPRVLAVVSVTLLTGRS
jgi:hypothetical protein